MTLAEQAEYLARCRASGCDEEMAEELLASEMERRAAALVAAEAAQWLAGVVATSRDTRTPDI